MAESENTNDKSRTLILSAFGGHDKIKVVEKARQKPGAGQVLVNIETCGINFAELMTRQGLYGVSKHPPKPPCELGWEGAGVVAELGEGVTTFQVCSVFDLYRIGGRGPGQWMDVATSGYRYRRGKYVRSAHPKCVLTPSGFISCRLI